MESVPLGRQAFELMASVMYIKVYSLQASLHPASCVSLCGCFLMQSRWEPCLKAASSVTKGKPSGESPLGATCSPHQAGRLAPPPPSPALPQPLAHRVSHLWPPAVSNPAQVSRRRGMCTFPDLPRLAPIALELSTWLPGFTGHMLGPHSSHTSFLPL